VDGVKGRLLDLDTGKVIPHVIWFNDRDGTFEAHRVDDRGRPARDPKTGDWLIWWGQGRLRFILARDVVTPPKPKPPVVVARARLEAALWHEECDRAGCGRRAEWQVSDEVDLPPVQRLVRGRLVQFARGKTVRTRHYCSKHYEPPRLLDARGEVMETFEDAGGVRPQWHS
jgi:hypothetical protein